MAPYPTLDGVVPTYRVVLDPVTQTGDRVDPSGQIIEAGKHGTNRAKTTATQVESGPDGGEGKPPPPPKPDSTTDYTPD